METPEIRHGCFYKIKHNKLMRCFKKDWAPVWLYIDIYGDLLPNNFAPSYYEEDYNGFLHPGFYKLKTPPGFQPKDEEGTPKQQIVVNNFENFWNYSRVLDCDVVDGLIQPSFFERRALAFQKKEVIHQIVPLKECVLGYYFGGFCNEEDYRKLYFKAYQNVVVGTKSYRRLVKKVQKQKVCIIGNHGTMEGWEESLTPEELLRRFQDPEYDFNYELVLIMLLFGFRM